MYRPVTSSVFTVTNTQYFKTRYRHRFLTSQLEICEDRAQRFADPALAAAMRVHIAQMRHRGEALIERHDGLPYGRESPPALQNPTTPLLPPF